MSEWGDTAPELCDAAAAVQTTRTLNSKVFFIGCTEENVIFEGITGLDSQLQGVFVLLLISKMSSRAQNDVILYMLLGRKITPAPNQKKTVTTRRERNREYAKVRQGGQ